VELGDERARGGAAESAGFGGAARVAAAAPVRALDLRSPAAAAQGGEAEWRCRRRAVGAVEAGHGPFSPTASRHPHRAGHHFFIFSNYEIIYLFFHFVSIKYLIMFVIALFKVLKV